MTDALAFARRTPLRRALEHYGKPLWKPLTDAAIVGSFDNATALTLGIADLTTLPRLGFKGRGTMAAMQARGFACESAPNRAFRQPDGGLCLVLAATEVFLLGGLDGDGGRFDALEREWRIEDGERTYPLPRRDSHAWLAIQGPATPETFAKLCAIDLRPHKFADLSIAQTSVARLNAVIVRADHGDVLTYHLLLDSAAASYMLACLLDAAGEFGGALIGLQTLKASGA